MEGLKLPLPELATTPLAERVEFHEIANEFKVPNRLLNGSRGLTDTPVPGTTTSVPVPLALADALKVAVWTSSAALAKEVRHAKVKRWMSFMDKEILVRWPRFLDHWLVKISDGRRGSVSCYKGKFFVQFSFGTGLRFLSP
jgi:hypothetical protein